MTRGQTPMGKPPRVLVVDDDPQLRALASLSLTRAGWQVVSAGPVEALDHAKRERFDTILLDVMMPGLDGPTLMAAMREGGASATAHVVFFTGNAEERDEQRYRKLGAAGVVAKPFNPLTLAQAVLGAIAGAEPILLGKEAIAHALDSMLEMFGGDSRALADLLEEQNKSASDLLERIQRSRAKGDEKELVLAAHTLKTTAITFGGARVAAIAERIERSPSASEVATWITDLTREQEAFAAQLAAWVRTQ